MENEKNVHESSATLFKGLEGVGGKLLLTKEALIHKPHKFNFQSNKTLISLLDIKSIEFYPNKFLFISIHNGLKVITHEGKEFRFVVYDRDIWKKTIDESIFHIKFVENDDE